MYSVELLFVCWRTTSSTPPSFSSSSIIFFRQQISRSNKSNLNSILTAVLINLFLYQIKSFVIDQVEGLTINRPLPSIKTQNPLKKKLIFKNKIIFFKLSQIYIKLSLVEFYVHLIQKITSYHILMLKKFKLKNSTQKRLIFSNQGRYYLKIFIFKKKFI